MKSSLEIQEAPMSTQDAPILIWDWNPERLQRLLGVLHSGFIVKAVENPEEIIECVSSKYRPHVVILPLRWGHSESSLALEKCSGFDLIDTLTRSSDPPQIILFENGLNRFTLSDYCRPFQKGVVAFLDESDPSFKINLMKKVEECVPQRRVRWPIGSLAFLENMGLVGPSSALHCMQEFVQKAAYLSDVPVLIAGHSGTGKELIARAVHHLDQKRSKGPFIAVNCSAVSGMLAESEFFGHKRGSFTGAVSDRPGYFRAAHQVFLYVDEMCELDIRLQPKLLRVLQENRILSVGEETEREVDIRVIAATNKDLAAQVARGEFRMDLYQRINVLSLTLPDLKSRKEDIEPLFHFFLKKYHSCYAGKINGVAPRVLELLGLFDFGGNVRELENLVRKILFQKNSGEMIEMADLPVEVLGQAVIPIPSNHEDFIEQFLLEKVAEGLSLSQVTDMCERLLFKKALQETQGSRSKVAHLLKINIRTLFNKMQRHHL